MSTTAFVFSGQGAQYFGMGEDLYKNSAKARAVYEQASDVLGFDVAKKSFGEDDGDLSQTKYSQPLIFTLSMAAYAELSDRVPEPACVAGHSLGECAALCAAGVLTLEAGLSIIGERAAAMQDAAERQKGAMFAILGRDEPEILAACEAADGYVVPVNYNCPGQIVIAGEEDAAVRASDALKDAGAKVVRLAVNAAFHSKMMEGASSRFKAAVAAIPFEQPRIPFYSNVTGAAMPAIPDVSAYLAQQMISPVRFTDELLAMNQAGIDTFVELGPGKTLCGLARKTIKGARTFPADNMQALEKAAAGIQE